MHVIKEMLILEFKWQVYGIHCLLFQLSHRFETFHDKIKISYMTPF